MKLFTLVTAIGLGLALSVGAQTYNNDQDQQQQQQQQQQPSKTTKAQQNTEQPAGPAEGHPRGEKMKDTSQPMKMKSGAAVNAKNANGATVQSTTVFRNGKQTSETLSFRQSTRDRTDVHFAIGTHPREWWLHTYSIAVISGCNYYLADDGCWYPAYGFDPSCNFPEGVVYCD